MKKIQFKSNINCGACVAKVTPVLNNEASIEKWSVDTTDPQKVVTVEGKDPDENAIVINLEKIGYILEKV